MVCVLQSNGAPHAMTRARNQGATEIKEQPASKSEFPPGQKSTTHHPSAMLGSFQVINEEVPLVTSAEFSPEFRDFVCICLQKDPLKRHAAEQLLEHPFIKKVRDPEALHSQSL